MSISALPLSYCTNVHPGRSVAEVLAGLDRYTIKVQEQLRRPMAAGLWLARPVIDELLGNPDGVARLKDALHARRLTCHTLNAFPFGDFHSARVKENVYLPDWTTDDRLNYTVRCARALAGLLEREVDGSISTLPLGFKGFRHDADFLDRAAAQLVLAAAALHELRDRTGKMIRLAIEPEPLCILETTAEAIDFFRRLHHHAQRHGGHGAVVDHIGLCFDVCHQAVEFEDIEQSIKSLDDAGIRINKLHLSCAIELAHPAASADGRAALHRYIEPRYLHQTLARRRDGEIARHTDLDEAFLAAPPADFADAAAWRIHFHVPVDAHRLGALGTTRPDLIKAITAVAELNYAPHLEVETYTWEVLPGAAPAELVDGLTREMASAQKLIDEIQRG